MYRSYLTTCVRFYLFQHTRLAGAASARHSLRPLPFEGQRRCKARTRRRAAGRLFHVLFAVIAREGGRSSIQRQQCLSRKATAYWMPRLRGA